MRSWKLGLATVQVVLGMCALQGASCLAAVTPSPTSLNWVSVAVGEEGAQKAVTLTNGGTGAITISSIALSGTDAADFTIFSKTCGTSLAASADCTVNILFGPKATGSRTATLNFTDTGSGSPQTVALSGTGTGTTGSVTMSPSELSFASTAIGSSSAAQPSTLTNGSAASITISSVAITGTDAGDFTISSKTCGTSLAAATNCTASVTFKPAATGTRTATLTFTDSASGSPQTVALTGTGTAGATGSASVSPSSLNWASVAMGDKGAQKVVTLTNGGTSAVTISSIAFSGADPGDFIIESKTCGTSLAASAACTVNVSFGPTAAGSRTATLNFTDTATGSPQTMALSGTGTGTSGSVTMSPSALTFASTAVGSTTAAQSATLSNGSAASITISSVAISGTDPGDFSISSKTCGTSLAAAASCTASVTFKPAAAGTRTATLKFTDSATGSPQSVSLTGTGASSTGTVTASPSSLSFTSTSVGSTSAAQSATLSNGSAASITISGVAISGTDAGDFSIASKTCGTSLAAAASCTASVTFKPAATGTRTATLTFTDSASGSPQSVSLSGTIGSVGAFTISPVTPDVVVNDALQFSASVDVTWTASCGTIGSSTGLYTAPATTGSCTVTATEVGNTSETVSTKATITTSPATGTLGIYPSSAAVFAGSEQIFQAQLGGVPDGHSLSYSVDGIADGNASVGTITNDGVYTAPSSAGTHKVTVRDNSLGTSISCTITVFSSVAVDFGSRAAGLHAVPEGLFGTERMDSMHNTGDLNLVKAGGINYARIYALIPEVFATSTPNWDPIDANVARISAGGVHIMLQIYQTPPWLQPSPNPCASGDGPNALPTNLTTWGQLGAQYVAHMDAKFPGVVTDYEIWNEPNTTALCVSASSGLSDYMNLYAAAAPLMRAQAAADHSTARVGGPATAGMQSSWVTAMLSNSTIAQNIDFLSYHDYMFSSSQLGAQWDTYNGTTSVLQRTQNTGNGPMDEYMYATRLVAAGLQPQKKNLPIYNSEFNLNWDYAKDCCENDFTYSPVWNGIYISDVLNSVYNGAPNTPSHMVYFAANAHPYFCLVGEIDANMDCSYPEGVSPQPYPQYFLYQLLGATDYLGLQQGGFMAKSIAPPTLGNGLVVTAFYTTGLDAIVLVNPTADTFSNVPVSAANTGLTSPSASLYQIVNGKSIESSSLSLTSTGGTSYSTTVTVGPYSVQAISIH